MKKLCSLIICLAATISSFAAAPSFDNESLSYRVMYKWGLINKQAGHATLTIRDKGDHFYARLVAASEPWADKFYCVRDTLNGTILKKGFRPGFYEKIAHEGSEDKHDTVKFSYSGNTVTGHCTRRVVKKGELKKNEKRTLTDTGTTVDMLSSYYYMRSLPFESWKPGHKETINIFSGKQKETLTFDYRGIEVVQIGDKRYQCFHLTFVFTGDGGKKTSDNMDAWITPDAARIPVQLEGKLPVGKVKCELIQ